jgi:class 3 adenylate cyclase
MDQIYPDNLNVSPRALDSHIKNLRRKLDRDHPGQPLIKAVYGVGFVYDADSVGQPRHDHLCVLFADVSNSRALYSLVGNEKAYALIEACLTHARDAVTRFNGKVIKLIGDEIMATFLKASDAADAACEIQRRISDMAGVGAKKLTLHIGFHFGEVLCAGGDIYGETVNIAAQLTKQAKPGQILYTASSIDSDAPASFMVATDVSGLALSPGNTVEEEIVELQWRRDFTITQASGFARPLSRAGQKMQIRYNNQCYQLDLENRLMTVGRDPNCSIPVSNLRASRLHATFELKADGIYLIDRSTNGTYVCFEDRPEFCVKHKELLLRSHGRLSLGQSITRESADLLFFDIRSGDA